MKLDSNGGAWCSRSSSAALFMRRFSRPFRGAPASAVDRGEQQAAGADAGAPAAQAPPAKGTLDQRFWSCPGDGGFRLRGKTYMQARGVCCRPRGGWQGVCQLAVALQAHGRCRMARLHCQALP